MLNTASSTAKTRPTRSPLRRLPSTARPRLASTWLRQSRCGFPARHPSAVRNERPPWRRIEIRGDGLSRRARHLRPDHQRRADRAFGNAALSGLLRQVPRPAGARRDDAVALLRPHGPPRPDRQMDPQVYLPGRLHPGLVGDRQRGRAAPADRLGRRDLRYHYAYTLEEWYRRRSPRARSLQQLYGKRNITANATAVPTCGRRRTGRSDRRRHSNLRPASAAASVDPVTPRYLMFEEEQRLRTLEEPPSGTSTSPRNSIMPATPAWPPKALPRLFVERRSARARGSSSTRARPIISAMCCA